MVLPVHRLLEEALDNTQPVSARTEAFNELAIAIGRKYATGKYTDQNDLIEDLLDVAASKDEGTWDRIEVVKSIGDIICEVAKKDTKLKRKDKKTQGAKAAKDFDKTTPDLSANIPYPEVVQQVMTQIAEDGNACDELRVAAILTYARIKKCYAAMGIENLKSHDGKIRRLPYMRTATPDVAKHAKMAVS